MSDQPVVQPSYVQQAIMARARLSFELLKTHAPVSGLPSEDG